MAAAKIPETKILLHLDEIEADFQPRDVEGNLADLAAPSGMAMPAVEPGYCSSARVFDGATTGLAAIDHADKDTLLQRDATVQVVIALADLVGPGPWCIYARGGNDGTAPEYWSLGLDIDVIPSPPEHVRVQLFWADSSGTEKRQPGGVFTYRIAGEFVLVTATRRWVSSTEVVCRYYVGEDLLDEVTSADGDIAGDTTATTTVGYRGDGAGGAEEILDGALDELRVTNYEMSLEEIRWTWRRITDYQDRGARVLALHMPPGSRWDDPGTDWGRLTKIAGRGLGLAWSKIDELRDNFLPDRAYQVDIERWEKLFAVAPGGADSLDQRRERVVATAARINGYSRAQVADLLAAAMDLTVDQVEIVEVPNQWRDEFTAIDVLRWEPEGFWSTSSGAANPDLASGGDARYNAPDLNGFRILTPLASARGRLTVETELASYTLPAGVLVGVNLFDRIARMGIWFGVYRSGGVNKVGYFLVTEGVAAAFVEIEASVIAPTYLRVVRDPTGRDAVDSDSDNWQLSWSVDGATWSDTDVVLAGFEPTQAGPAVFSTATWAAGAYAAAFAYWYQDTPEGLLPCHWYVWRDVGTYGVGHPDIGLARALIRAVKPAHTHGSAITSKSLLLDDPVDGSCDAGPLGGL